MLKEHRPHCSTEAHREGGGCRGEGECELERCRAVPFADWNEWYGAAVTIHACSFTPFGSLPISLHSLISPLETFRGKSGERDDEKELREK